MPYGKNFSWQSVELPHRVSGESYSQNRPKRKPPSRAYTPPASLGDAIAAAFAQLPTPQCRPFLGLHNTRVARNRITLELRHSLTGEHFYLGTFPASDYQTVTASALAAIERERKQLAAQFRTPNTLARRASA